MGAPRSGRRLPRGGWLAAALLAGVAAVGIASPRASKPRLRQVAIAGFAFRPARLVVSAGDTVEWRNGDIVPHSASATDARAFDSPDLDPKAAWRWVARKKGTFAYVCALHPTMKGTLVVK